jgi:hypothetical protein
MDTNITWDLSPAGTVPWTGQWHWNAPVVVPEVPRACACGAPVTRERVVTAHRRVPHSKHVIATATHDAVVCAKCGVVAWYDAPDPA